MNNKVVSLFSGKNSDVNKKGGYSFVTLKEDVNGIPLKEEQLLKYKDKIRYIIRISRKTKNKVFLDNYDVPSDKIDDFFSKYAQGCFEGTIIEIYKYEPQNFA